MSLSFWPVLVLGEVFALNRPLNFLASNVQFKLFAMLTFRNLAPGLAFLELFYQLQTNRYIRYMFSKEIRS